MATIDILLDRLRPPRLAQEIGLAHDNARLRYPVDTNTVSTFEAYYDRIGDYYSYHHSSCIARGGQLSRAHAAQDARQILEREYRNRGGIQAAYIDARDGTNGGVRTQLDKIAEALKSQALSQYVGHVFDTLVAPSSWEEQKELIRQFVDKCGAYLSHDIKADTPERHARDYRRLVEAYVEGLGATSALLRSL